MDTTVNVDWVKEAIRDVPDFPKPGVLFRDLTPLLQDAARLRAVVGALADRYRNQDLHTIASIEARGFLLGSALAYELGVSLVPIRKQGKLPRKTSRVTYDLEYGTDTVEIHTDAVGHGHRVLVLDDVLATGGTSKAAADLIQQLHGQIVEMAFLIELTALGGRAKLGNLPAFSLIQY